MDLKLEKNVPLPQWEIISIRRLVNVGSDVSNDGDLGDEDDSDFEDLEINAEYDLALVKEQSAISTSPAMGHTGDVHHP